MILDYIEEINKKHPSHGYRWINAMLKQDYKIRVSDNYAYKCCRYLGIKAKSKHVGRPSRKERDTIFNNLVMRTWKNVTRPFEIIVSDMTAFYANYRYYELTLYFDVLTKLIVGASLTSKRGSREPYLDGLKQVLDKIKDESQTEVTIIHTDQGSVYSSKAYNELLINYNIKRSMSRAGTPTDNPMNESLNGWIKEELFVDFDLAHSKDVPKLIQEYIDYYNYRRPAYSLDYMTPAEKYLEYRKKVPNCKLSTYEKENDYLFW